MMEVVHHGDPDSPVLTFDGRKGDSRKVDPTQSKRDALKKVLS